MRAILFDIDGTLIHTGGAGRDALHTALEVVFAVKDPYPVDLSGRTDRGIARELFAAHDIPPTEENWHKFREAYLAGLDVHLPAKAGRVLPGVRELIALLEARSHVALGLLTGNVREGARRKLAYYQLDRHFATGGFGDTHPHRDDVAREALAAMRTKIGAHLSGDEVWIIGDTPLDIRCARAIGARVLAVATGSHSAEELSAHAPDLVAADLSDTAALAERLLAA